MIPKALYPAHGAVSEVPRVVSVKCICAFVVGNISEAYISDNAGLNARGKMLKWCCCHLNHVVLLAYGAEASSYSSHVGGID